MLAFDLFEDLVVYDVCGLVVVDFCVCLLTCVNSVVWFLWFVFWLILPLLFDICLCFFGVVLIGFAFVFWCVVLFGLGCFGMFCD